MKRTWVGKVAIVTGGASGIGRAIAGELVSRGADVVIADISDAVGAVAAELGCKSAQLDVRDAKAVSALVSDVGRLDAMFNNAGIAVFGLAEDMSDEQWERVVDVNLHGVLNGMRAAYRVMLRQGYGHIVNTASMAGLLPIPLQLPYATTKYAVVGASLALRTEAARHGVNVSVVCPGIVETPIVQAVQLAGNTFDRERLFAQIPRQIVGTTPERCARVVVDGVERKRGVITVTAMARFMWMLTRVSPALVVAIGSMLVKRADSARLVPAPVTRDALFNATNETR